MLSVRKTVIDKTDIVFYKNINALEFNYYILEEWRLGSLHDFGIPNVRALVTLIMIKLNRCRRARQCSESAIKYPKKYTNVQKIIMVDNIEIEQYFHWKYFARNIIHPKNYKRPASHNVAVR